MVITHEESTKLSTAGCVEQHYERPPKDMVDSAYKWMLWWRWGYWNPIWAVAVAGSLWVSGVAAGWQQNSEQSNENLSTPSWLKGCIGYMLRWEEYAVWV